MRERVSEGGKETKRRRQKVEGRTKKEEVKRLLTFAF
jgi:hypothetical protein